MNKTALSFFICLVILSVNVSAITTTLNNEYAQKETMIFEVKGNILEPIMISQIKFFRGHVEMPLDKGVSKIGESTYVWAQAPSQNGTYTLEIRNISTTVLGESKRVTHIQNFSVGLNLTEYSIKPGIVYTKTNFEIEVQLYQDEEVPISVSFPEAREVVLKPGANTISFDVSSLREPFYGLFSVGKYNVPAGIIVKNQTVPATGGFSELPLRFEPLSLRRVVFDDSPINILFIVENFGEDEIKGLQVHYNRDIFEVEPKEISILADGDKLTFNLTLLQNATLPFSGIDESINFTSGNMTNSIPVRIERLNVTARVNVSENQTNNTNAETGLYRCIELGGSTCTTEQVCSGRAVSTLDGACCIGLCGAKTSTGGSKAWMGWVGVLIALGLAGFAWYKYKIIKPSAPPIGGPITPQKSLPKGLQEEKGKNIP